jgi:hypothetical protein
MSTLRQIVANRRNAERSTGPRTEGGKRRTRRNALRHGLCAETVVETLEAVEDYRAFEVAIASEYDAQSVVERELVLRLASLLWRIRRATGIETALLRSQAENLGDGLHPRPFMLSHERIVRDSPIEQRSLPTRDDGREIALFPVAGSTPQAPPRLACSTLRA